MRCRCCNRLLSNEDILAVRYVDENGTKHYEDFCHGCRNATKVRDAYTTTHEYMFEDLETDFSLLLNGG